MNFAILFGIIAVVVLIGANVVMFRHFVKRNAVSMIGVLLLLSSTPAFANFNYGYDTYAQDGTTLILNSTGDQVTNSTFKNLGSNDFIAELAVKNELALAGYTQAYDYNPKNTDGQFSANYNQSLPNVPLTKLTFAGFLGDPRSTQDVYVLTSEYNALSAEGQANSIAGLQSATSALTNSLNAVSTTVAGQGSQIAVNTGNISSLNSNVSTITSDVNNITNVVNVQGQNLNNIAGVVGSQGNQIDGLQGNVGQLNGQVAVNTANIAQNTGDIGNLYGITGTHTAQIASLNNGLAVTNQNVQAVANTTVIEQQEINTNANNINTVNNVQTNWNHQQDGQINALQTTQQGQQNQINGLNNRVGALERTQDIVGGQVRVYDSRKWQVNAFLDYSATRNVVSSVGVRVTYKLGKSYEETQIDELNHKLNVLLGKKDLAERQSKIETYYTGNGVGMRENF